MIKSESAPFPRQRRRPIVDYGELESAVVTAGPQRLAVPPGKSAEHFQAVVGTGLRKRGVRVNTTTQRDASGQWWLHVQKAPDKARDATA